MFRTWVLHFGILLLGLCFLAAVLGGIEIDEVFLSCSFYVIFVALSEYWVIPRVMKEHKGLLPLRKQISAGCLVLAAGGGCWSFTVGLFFLLPAWILGLL